MTEFTMRARVLRGSDDDAMAFKHTVAGIDKAPASDLELVNEDTRVPTGWSARS